ncbi:MAG TPA: hypothetical protein VEB86_05715 [Chryseosolibacter sp.]|nr:hypothetical protein [Chryseosolibacter sp.]
MKTKDLTFIMLLIGSCYVASAQDTVLLSPKWQKVFTEASRAEYLTFEPADFDKKFKRGELYDGLIIFKDSTKQSLPLRILYSGIIDLCDLKKPIRGKDMKIATGYEIAKKDIKYFVFHDLVFAYEIVRKDYAVSFDNKYWSMLLIDGPVRFTKGFYTSSSSAGTMEIGGARLQKGEETIGSDLATMGGFGFKKFGTKTFADHKELADKIAAEQEGYKKKDAAKIIFEYNDWVKQQDPAAYRESLMLKKYINP